MALYRNVQPLLMQTSTTATRRCAQAEELLVEQRRGEARRH